MWRKHQSVYQDHLKYIHNDIVKPFRVGIIRYAERVQEMHGLAKYLPPPPMKGKNFDEASWKLRNKEFYVHEIQVSIKDVLPLSMQYELKNNQEDYCYLTREYRCDLLSTIGVKYNSKRAETQIKRIATSRVAFHYDINESIRVTRKTLYNTVVLYNRKQQVKKTPKHHSPQRYYILCKKA